MLISRLELLPSLESNFKIPPPPLLFFDDVPRQTSGIRRKNNRSAFRLAGMGNRTACSAAGQNQDPYEKKDEEPWSAARAEKCCRWEEDLGYGWTDWRREISTAVCARPCTILPLHGFCTAASQSLFAFFQTALCKLSEDPQPPHRKYKAAYEWWANVWKVPPVLGSVRWRWSPPPTPPNGSWEVRQSFRRGSKCSILTLSKSLFLAGCRIHAQRCWTVVFQRRLRNIAKKERRRHQTFIPTSILVSHVALVGSFQVHLLYTEGALKPPPLARGRLLHSGIRLHCPPGAAAQLLRLCCISTTRHFLPCWGISRELGGHHSSEGLCLLVRGYKRSKYLLDAFFEFLLLFFPGVHCGSVRCFFFFFISPTLALFFMFGSVFFEGCKHH